MRVYLIGIGGIGMCGVAGILKNSGFEVFGSERNNLYPPSSEILKRLKIPLYSFDKKNISKIKPQAVIVGNAIKSDHPEVLEAQKLKIPLYSFPSFLEKYFLYDKKVLVCAGTHGKTTVSALLSYVLEIQNLDPTYLVGGVLKHTSLNFRKGEGNIVVIEGDEYPSSFFDPSPKFLHYLPFSLILTSLEQDHVDVYPDIKSLKEIFKKLISLIPKEGVIVYNSDDKNLKDLLSSAKIKAKLISYGKNNRADFRLLKSETIFEKGSFRNYVTVSTPFQEKLEFILSIPGEYNALNALSVLALIYGLNLPLGNWKFAFENFPGVKRRQEVLYAEKNLVIIDDFAHHPSAVEKTLKELQKIIKPEKSILIFEPRTNSSKRKIFEERYIKSLSIADTIYLKIPPGLEDIPEDERLDINNLFYSLKKQRKEVYFVNKDTKFLKDISQRTLLIFMSSAYFKEEIENLEKELKERKLSTFGFC